MDKPKRAKPQTASEIPISQLKKTKRGVVEEDDLEEQDSSNSSSQGTILITKTISNNEQEKVSL